MGSYQSILYTEMICQTYIDIKYIYTHHVCAANCFRKVRTEKNGYSVDNVRCGYTRTVCSDDRVVKVGVKEPISNAHLTVKI